MICLSAWWFPNQHYGAGDTQKRETMFDFWCRLAAEEGIIFWFEDGSMMFYSGHYLGMKAGLHLTDNPQSETDLTDRVVIAWHYVENLCSDICIDKDYSLYVRPT